MASNETKWNSIILDNGNHDLRLSLTILNVLDKCWDNKLHEILDTTQVKCNRQCGTKWVLKLIYYNSLHVAVYLQLVDKPSHAEDVTATYHFYVLGKDGTKEKISQTFNQIDETNLKEGVGCEIIYKREIVENKELYVVDGHLTIRCEGTEFLNNHNDSLTIESLPQFVSSSHYSELVKKMYQEKICCDVVLKAGSSEFNCHKTILAATSNYFKAMFQHDMKENRENAVDLSKDLKGEELKAMLDYVYMGSEKLPTLSTDASYQTLLRVSDMYEIGGLRNACEEALLGRVTSDNALDLLVFAAQFRAKRLKKKAASLIANEPDSE